MVEGLLHDHSMVVDPFMANDIKNYLFRAKHEKVGADLPAFNIQRGRDHGIPPYHVYLKFCFGFEAYSWDDLGKFIPQEELYEFKKIYKYNKIISVIVSNILKILYFKGIGVMSSSGLLEFPSASSRMPMLDPLSRAF